MMKGFTSILPTSTLRIRQQNIMPSAIKPSNVANIAIVNTASEILGPVSLNDGSGLSVKSILTNTVNENFRIGAIPPQIVFFEGSLNVNNIIGDGVTGYTVNGPMAMPQFTPLAYSNPDGSIELGGSDGNNLVFLTELINNTGGTETIYVIVSTRVYSPTTGFSGGEGANL